MILNNDLVDPVTFGTKITIYLFAVDATMMYVKPTEQLLISKISPALTNIGLNRFVVNIDKSNLVIFFRSPNCFSWIKEIYSYKKIVKNSRSVKYIGINVDENLTFKYLMEAIFKTSSRS